MSDQGEVYSSDVKSSSGRRVQIVIDLVQDTIIYFVLSLIAGIMIERFFFPEQPNDITKHSTFTLIVLILLQLIFDAVAIYYIELIAETIPSVVRVGPDTVRIRTQSVNIVGGVVISLVFIAAQRSLILRIREVIDRVNGSI